MTTTTPRKRGRPRDSSADRRILDATIELVGELGVAGASMSAIAERAGVGKPTIYIRWPNRQAVIAAALAEVMEGLEAEDREALESCRQTVGLIEAFLPHGRFLLEAFVMPRAEVVMGERV